jgi:trehalose-phosphatase
MKNLLTKISQNPRCKLAIVSGRSLKDIKERVGIDGIVYSGNHGLELQGPKIKYNAFVYPGYRMVLEEIKEKLLRDISQIDGALLEDKGFSLTLHYRQVKKELIPKLKTLFHEATAINLVKGKIKVKRGKMIYEIRPPVKWDKGRAVLWLISRWKFILGNENTIPVYVGDDVTDEDAFRAVKGKGLTIFVGGPRQSQAEYYIKDCEETSEFLEQILQLQQEGKCQS